jgi:hypothetical protein
MARSKYIGNIARDVGWRHVGEAIEVYRIGVPVSCLFQSESESERASERKRERERERSSIQSNAAIFVSCYMCVRIKNSLRCS